MTAEANDLIERAMDAAEAKLMGETKEEAVVEEAAPSEKPTSPTEEAHVAKAIIDDDKKSKSRDSSGKFVKKASAPKTESLETKTDLNDQVAPVEVPEIPEMESIEPPAFWSAEKKEAFAKAPLEVKQAVLEHEEQRNQWANRLANESERGRAIEKRATEVFSPYQLKLQANGIKDPLEAAERLLAWNELFEQDVETGLVDLMQKNGITPEYLAQVYYGTREANQYSDDPRIAQALEQAEEAKRAAEEFKAQLEQQQQQSFVHEVNSFKAGKDSTGQVRKAFAELYAPQISKAHEEILRLYPQLPFMESLNKAYEYVKAEVKKYHGAPSPVSTPSVSAKKAQGAASSVTGGPSSGSVASRPSAKTIDEALDRAEERLGLR